MAVDAAQRRKTLCSARVRSVLCLTVFVLNLSACTQTNHSPTPPTTCDTIFHEPATFAVDMSEQVSLCTEDLLASSTAEQDASAKTYARNFTGQIDLKNLSLLADETRGEASLIFAALASRAALQTDFEAAAVESARLLAKAQTDQSQIAEAVARASMGTVAYKRNEYSAALAEFRKALALSKDAKMAGFAPSVLTAMGAAYERTAQYDEALAVYQSAFAALPRLSDDALNLLCDNTGSLASKDAFASDAELKDLVAEADSKGENAFAACLVFASSARAVHRGEPELISRRLQDTIARIEGTRLESIRPKITHRLGQHLYMKGEFSAALEHYEEALIGFREHGNLQNQSILTNSIANVYADMGDYDRSIEMYKKAGALFRKASVTAPGTLATINANIGWVLAMQGKHEEANAEYATASRIMEVDPAHRLNGFLNYHYAKSLLETGARSEAITRAEAAIPVILETRNPLEAAAIHSWLAGRHVEDKEWSKAENALNSAEAIISRDDVDLGSLDGDASYRYWEADYHSNMAAVFGKMGRPQEALVHAQRALDLGNSRFEKEQLEAAANFELKLDLWERDQALESAARDTELQELRLQQSRVQVLVAIVIALLAGLGGFFAYRSYRMQKRIAHMSSLIVAEEHHRTKNALQLASSLTRQHERDATGDMREIRQRLMTMALLHDHLHTANEGVSVDACAFLTELGNRVCAAMSQKGTIIYTRCEAVMLTPGIATPLGLIVCEMIINSCKHALPKGSGTIEVSLTAKNGTACLKVRDDGLGNQAAAGTVAGLGFELIEDLAAQIGATANFVQNEDGSAWILEGIPYIRRTDARLEREAAE